MNACFVYVQLLWLMFSGASEVDRMEWDKWVNQIQNVSDSKKDQGEDQRTKNKRVFFFQPDTKQVSFINTGNQAITSLFELKNAHYVPTDLLVSDKDEFWVAWHDQPGVQVSKLVKYDSTGRQLREWEVGLYGLNQLIGSERFVIAKSGDVNNQLETGIAVLDQKDPVQGRIVYVPGIVVFMKMINESEAVIISNKIDDGRSLIWFYDALSNQLTQMTDQFLGNDKLDTEQLLQLHLIDDQQSILVVRSIEENQEKLILFDKSKKARTQQQLLVADHIFSIAIQKNANRIVAGTMSGSSEGQLIVLDTKVFKENERKINWSRFPTKISILDDQIFALDEMSGAAVQLELMDQRRKTNVSFSKETWLITETIK